MNNECTFKEFFYSIRYIVMHIRKTEIKGSGIWEKRTVLFELDLLERACCKITSACALVHPERFDATNQPGTSEQSQRVKNPPSSEAGSQPCGTCPRTGGTCDCIFHPHYEPLCKRRSELHQTLKAIFPNGRIVRKLPRLVSQAVKAAANIPPPPCTTETLCNSHPLESKDNLAHCQKTPSSKPSFS